MEGGACGFVEGVIFELYQDGLVRWGNDAAMIFNDFLFVLAGIT